MDMITGRVEEAISVKKKFQKIWRGFEKNPFNCQILNTNISRYQICMEMRFWGDGRLTSSPLLRFFAILTQNASYFVWKTVSKIISIFKTTVDAHLKNWEKKRA